MLTIEQLRQEITNKNYELEGFSRELRGMTTQYANQQRLVTRKENQIADLVRRQPNLTTIENTKLITLKRELSADQQELTRRDTEWKRCSQRETDLICELGSLKMQLETLERSGAMDYSSNSRRHGR